MQAWVPAPALFPASQQKLYSQYAVRLCNARNAIAKQSDFRISRCCVAQLSTRQELLGTFRAEPAGATGSVLLCCKAKSSMLTSPHRPRSRLPVEYRSYCNNAGGIRRGVSGQHRAYSRIGYQSAASADPHLPGKEIQVAYSQVKEVRTAPRAFGLWGDMVVFLKDGSRLEIPGVEKYQELKAYIEKRIS